MDMIDRLAKDWRNSTRVAVVARRIANRKAVEAEDRTLENRMVHILDDMVALFDSCRMVLDNRMADRLVAVLVVVCTCKCCSCCCYSYRRSCCHHNTEEKHHNCRHN